jgi:ribonuclease P protein component
MARSMRPARNVRWCLTSVRLTLLDAPVYLCLLAPLVVEGRQSTAWVYPSRRKGLVKASDSGAHATMDRAAGNEADVQTAQSQAGQQARVPRAHEDEGRAQDAESSQTARSRSDRPEDRREVDPGPRAEGLPRGARIHSSSEIRRLLEKGTRQRTASLDVFTVPAAAARSRLGLIVPRHGRRIVDRNLLKRRLREIGRRQVLPSLDGRGAFSDLLIRARPSAYRADFDSLQRELAKAVEVLCSRVS